MSIYLIKNEFEENNQDLIYEYEKSINLSKTFYSIRHCLNIGKFYRNVRVLYIVQI